jgi:hypothetical protein
MSNREVKFIALGRFLAVECYRESHQPASPTPSRSLGADRTGGHASRPDWRNGSRAPARPQHR